MKVGLRLKTALKIFPWSEQVRHVRKWTNASALLFRFCREDLASTVAYRSPSARTQLTLSDGIFMREAHGHPLRKTPEGIVFPIVIGMISKEPKALSATRVFNSVYHRFFFFTKVSVTKFPVVCWWVSLEGTYGPFRAVSLGVVLNIGMERKRWEMVRWLSSRSSRDFILTHHSSWKVNATIVRVIGYAGKLLKCGSSIGLRESMLCKIHLCKIRDLRQPGQQVTLQWKI